RSWGGVSPWGLEEPGGCAPSAVVGPDVRAEVDDVRQPRGHHARRRATGVIDLLGAIALDVVDDVSARAVLEGAPLALDHLCELGIIHTGYVDGVARQQRLEIGAGTGGAPANRQHPLVELAAGGAGNEGLVVLHLEIRLDTGGLPILEGDLDGIHPFGPVPRRRLDRDL